MTYWKEHRGRRKKEGKDVVRRPTRTIIQILYLPLNISISFFLFPSWQQKDLIFITYYYLDTFFKDTLHERFSHEVLNWEVEAKSLRSWLLSEFNCTALVRSFNLSVLRSPYLVKWEWHRPHRLLWGVIRYNICKLCRVLEEGAI